MATRLRALIDSARPLVGRLASRLPEPFMRRIGPLAEFLTRLSAESAANAGSAEAGSLVAGAAEAGPVSAAPAFSAADIPPPAPLAYADVLAWAKATGRSARFKAGGDHLEIGKEGLRLEVAPNRWVPVSPRLALPLYGDLPAIHAEDLAPLAEGAPYAHVFKLDIGPPTSWDTIAAAVSPADGGLLGDAGILLRLGVLTPDAASAALDAAREGEPLDMALSRLGTVNLDTWLEALIGRQALFPPVARPFKERIGMRLLAAHAISQGQLKQALQEQAAAGPHRLLGQILGLPDAALAKALEGQNPLPGHFAEADSLGEVLIRWGCVTRTDWLAAQMAGPDAAGTLVKAGKVLPSHVARAKAYREALGRLLASRSVRLGHVLVERGLDRGTLGKALAWQVDQPLPLAELMVLHRLLAPGEAARALGQQSVAFRSLAESGLPALESRSRPGGAGVAVPHLPGRRRRFPRQAYALGVFGIFCLAYAVAYGVRQRGADYGWFNLFFPRPAQSAPLYRPPGGEVHEVSESSRLKKPAAVQRLDRLDLPLGRLGLDAASGASAEFGALQEAVGLTPGGPKGRLVAAPGANAELTLALPFGRRLPAPDAATAGAADRDLDRAVPSMGPPRRFPAPTFGRERPAEPIAQPSFGPLSARVGNAEREGNPFSYPMEKALSLATPEPGPRLAGSGSPPGAGEPAAMRRFRADLARLRSAESRHRQRGRDLRQEGQENAARQELALAENVRRSQAVFRARIGQAYWRDGDYVAAAAELKGAFHDDPTFALPRYYLATIAQAQGDHAGAIGHFRTYLELAPEGEFAEDSRKALIAYGEKPPPRP